MFKLRETLKELLSKLSEWWYFKGVKDNKDEFRTEIADRIGLEDQEMNDLLQDVEDRQEDIKSLSE